jgi:hypothetical protein
MMCFGFSSPSKNVTLHLAEETIVYQTYRNDGVKIVGTLILKIPSNVSDPVRVGVWHRVQVNNLNFKSTEQLLNSDDYYTKIFSKITPGRAISLKDDRQISFRPFQENFGSIEPLENKIIAYIPSPEQILHKENNLITINDPAYTPFTYYEIELPKIKNEYVAIRVSGEIKEPALSRLIFEDYTLRKRYYPVYGRDYLLSEIESSDMPVFLRYCEKNEIINEYFKREEFYKEKLYNDKLIPEFYSIIVIDEDKAINSTFAVKINSGTRNLSQYINGNFLKNCSLFWFVSNKNAQNFRLRFESILPKIDIENKSAKYQKLSHQYA